MALKKKQEEFIMALMESNTNDEAIQKAGLSQSTAYKYLRDSDFQAEYKRIRRVITRCSIAAQESDFFTIRTSVSRANSTAVWLYTCSCATIATDKL